MQPFWIIGLISARFHETYDMTTVNKLNAICVMSPFIVPPVIPLCRNGIGKTGYSIQYIWDNDSILMFMDNESIIMFTKNTYIKLTIWNDPSWWHGDLVTKGTIKFKGQEFGTGRSWLFYNSLGDLIQEDFILRWKLLHFLRIYEQNVFFFPHRLNGITCSHIFFFR